MKRRTKEKETEQLIKAAYIPFYKEALKDVIIPPGFEAIRGREILRALLSAETDAAVTSAVEQERVHAQELADQTLAEYVTQVKEGLQTLPGKTTLKDISRGKVKAPFLVPKSVQEAQAREAAAKHAAREAKGKEKVGADELIDLSELFGADPGTYAYSTRPLSPAPPTIAEVVTQVVPPKLEDQPDYVMNIINSRAAHDQPRDEAYYVVIRPPPGSGEDIFEFYAPTFEDITKVGRTHYAAPPGQEKIPTLRSSNWSRYRKGFGVNEDQMFSDIALHTTKTGYKITIIRREGGDSLNIARSQLAAIGPGRERDAKKLTAMLERQKKLFFLPAQQRAFQAEVGKGTIKPTVIEVEKSPLKAGKTGSPQKKRK